MKVEAASFPKDLVLDILKFQQPDMIQIVSRRGPTWASLVEKLERDNSSENRDSRLMTYSELGLDFDQFSFLGRGRVYRMLIGACNPT